MIPYVLLFMIGLALYARREDYAFSSGLVLLIAAACVMIGLRAPGVDRDFYVYLEHYIRPASRLADYLSGARYQNEPGITFLSSLVVRELRLGYQWVFLLVAFLSLPVKAEAFRRAIPEQFHAALLLHLANTLFLHEMTQIRASVAIGLFLLSIDDIFKRRPLGFILKICLGAAFHYSVLAVLPLYAVYGLLIGRRGLLIAMLAALVTAMASSPFWLPALFELVPRLSWYFNTGSINFFNPLVLLRLAIVGLALLRRRRSGELDEKDLFYLIVYGLGLGLFYSLHSSPGIALRMSQVFFSLDPLAIPTLLRGYRKGTRQGLVLAVAMGLFLANLYYIKIVGPYAASFQALW